MKNQIAAKRVMLIPDGFSPAALLPRLLAAEGYEVILAQNEQEVQAELVTDSRLNLILLEMQMNAIKILHLIRSMQPQIPVIVMAEPSLQNLALESIEFGAWVAVPRPLDFRLLKELVQRAIQNPPRCRSAQPN